MEEKSDIKGKIAISCFFTIWCGMAFGMGIFLLQTFPFERSTAPLIFEIVMFSAPFVMGTIGLCIWISILRGKGGQPPTITSYRPETIVYTGDYTINPEFSGEKRSGKAVYQIPSTCPACGAAISNEEVDWIGPLQAKCPYCSTTIDAEERFL